MSNLTQPSGTENKTDRIVIRELIDSYAHYADRREAEKQAALFTEDAVIEVYQGEPDAHKPVQVLRGRSELADGFAGLKKYDVTTHLNAQSIITIDHADRATGISYCMAHHLLTEQGKRTLIVMSIRYYDTFSRQNGKWLFAERKLIIDWADSRPSTS